MIRSSSAWLELIRRRPIQRTEDLPRLEKRLAGLVAALTRERVAPDIRTRQLTAARRAGLRLLTPPPELRSQKFGGRSLPFKRFPRDTLPAALRSALSVVKPGTLLPIADAHRQRELEERFLSAIHDRVWRDYGPHVQSFVVLPHPDLPPLIRRLGLSKAYRYWLDASVFSDPSLLIEPPMRRVKIPKDMQLAIDRRIKARAKFKRYDEPEVEL